MFDLGAYMAALAVLCSIAVATWLVSLLKHDVSIVDSVWSLLIWAAGAVYAWTAAELDVRAWLMFALLTIWAARLSIHVTARSWGEPEDRRYQKIRANNQPYFEMKSVYIVFLLQAGLAWLISLPLLAAARSTAPTGMLDIAGAALAVFGIAFESIADWQLAAFKARPGSHGQVLREGLWRYSRHPNYFGECCTWWGFWLIAMPSGAWWSLASPVLMTVLLLRVSGVTLLERDIGERRPEYARYVERTSAFVPWFPRS